VTIVVRGFLDSQLLTRGLGLPFGAPLILNTTISAVLLGATPADPFTTVDPARTQLLGTTFDPARTQLTTR
jgi:hypothetical protein